MSSSNICELVSNSKITEDFFILQFVWEHQSPKAGQFFMIKPLRTSVFLPRPIGIFDYDHDKKIVKFLIAKRGKGTQELSHLFTGEKVQLTGPIGNSWSEFFPENKHIALVGGSAGIAPLSALVSENRDYHYHFFAGFKHGFRGKEEEELILGAGSKARKVVITAEDGKNALIGKIVDFIFEPENYDAMFACGPVPMLKALKKKCEIKKVPCYISMETRLACGTGACLGCSINTVNGYKRCCKDGPIFNAAEVIFND